MIEKINMMAAACNVTMGVGGAAVTNFENGCHVTHPSPGVYVVTLDQNVPLSMFVHHIGSLIAAGTACVFSTVLTSPGTPPVTTLTITTAATLGGAAADIAGSFGFTVYAIGAPGTTGL